VREDANPRGRQRGEIAGHVMEGIKGAGESRVQSAEIIIDEGPAIDAALERAAPGDVVLLCVDKPADTWRNLEARRALPVSPGT
jgi:cyanophycin synthetase